MPTFPYQNVASFLNKRISKTITPQKYFRSAMLYFLWGMTGNGDLLDIDRPNESIYIAGSDIDPIERERTAGTYEFTVRIQSFKTSATQVTGVYGTMPTTANPTTSTPDLALMNSAMFRWTANIDTPVQVWNTYLQTAQNASDGGISAGVLLADANKVAMQEHIDNLNSRCIYGAPSNQDAYYWDDIAGVISACTPTNTYGNVNRAALPAASPWIPQYAATAPLDVTRLVDYCNTTLGMNQFGDGITLILAGNANYLALKNQALSRDKGGYMIENAGKAGLPGLAKIGITREIVCCNGAYIMSEPFLDTCYGTQYQSTTPLYTAQPNYVIALNMRTWKFFTHPSYSMTATDMVDLSKYTAAANNWSQAFIKTWACLQCVRPDSNALFLALA